MEILIVLFGVGFYVFLYLTLSPALQDWAFERFIKDSKLQEKIQNRIVVFSMIVGTTAMIFAPMPGDFIDYSGGPGRYALLGTIRGVIGLLLGLFVGRAGLGAVLLTLILGTAGTVFGLVIWIITWLYQH
jgi:hypothetical protein